MKFLPVYTSLGRRNELLGVLNLCQSDKYFLRTNLVFHIVPGTGDAEMLNFRGHKLHPQGKDI